MTQKPMVSVGEITSRWGMGNGKMYSTRVKHKNIIRDCSECYDQL